MDFPSLFFLRPLAFRDPFLLVFFLVLVNQGLSFLETSTEILYQVATG